MSRAAEWMASSVAPISCSSLYAGTTNEITRSLNHSVARLRGDFGDLAGDALPAAVAHDEDVDVAERDSQRLAFARAGEMLRHVHDGRIAVDADDELVEHGRVNLLIEFRG